MARPRLTAISPVRTISISPNGRTISAYRLAIDLARNERERAFLERRLAEVRQLAGID